MEEGREERSPKKEGTEAEKARCEKGHRVGGRTRGV